MPRGYFIIFEYYVDTVYLYTYSLLLFCIYYISFQLLIFPMVMDHLSMIDISQEHYNVQRNDILYQDHLVKLQKFHEVLFLQLYFQYLSIYLYLDLNYFLMLRMTEIFYRQYSLFSVYYRLVFFEQCLVYLDL